MAHGLVVDLLKGEESWSRGERAAWAADGSVLFEFGPRGEKRVKDKWFKDEKRELERVCREQKADKEEDDDEFWGLVSLCIPGQQRTGLQCRTYYRRWLRQNGAAAAAALAPPLDDEPSRSRWREARRREAELCVRALRLRAAAAEVPLAGDNNPASSSSSSPLIRITELRPVDEADAACPNVAADIDDEEEKEQKQKQKGEREQEEEEEEPEEEQEEEEHEEEPEEPPMMEDFPSSLMSESYYNYGDDNDDDDDGDDEDHVDDDNDDAVAPTIISLVDDDDDARTSSSTKKHKRKFVMTGSDEDEDDNDVVEEVADEVEIVSEHMTAQQLHDLVVTRIIRECLDACQVLERKANSLRLENRTRELEGRANALRRRLCQSYRVEEPDDFLNGFDSSIANPDVPKGMAAGVYEELKLVKDRDHACARTKQYQRKACALLDQAETVEVVMDEEEEGEEAYQAYLEEEEEEEAHDDNDEDDEEEDERVPRVDHKKKDKRKRKSTWVAQPSANREGEAVEVSARRMGLGTVVPATQRRRQVTRSAGSSTSSRPRSRQQQQQQQGVLQTAPVREEATEAAPPSRRNGAGSSSFFRSGAGSSSFSGSGVGSSSSSRSVRDVLGQDLVEEAEEEEAARSRTGGGSRRASGNDGDATPARASRGGSGGGSSISRRHQAPNDDDDDDDNGHHKKPRQTSPAAAAAHRQHRPISGNTSRNSTNKNRSSSSSSATHPHRPDARHGTFRYHTSDISYMPIAHNAELPSRYEHAAFVAAPLLTRAPIPDLTSRRFFKPLPLPVAAVVHVAQEEQSVMHEEEAVIAAPAPAPAPSPPAALPPRPFPLLLLLPRKIASCASLDDLVFDFTSNTANSSREAATAVLSLWGDILDRLDSSCSPAYARTLIRPLVERVRDIPSATQRCLMLKSLADATMGAGTGCSVLAGFLSTYDFLECGLLVQQEEQAEDVVRVLPHVAQWGGWPLVLGCLHVLRTDRPRYDVYAGMLDAWEEEDGEAGGTVWMERAVKSVIVQNAGGQAATPPPHPRKALRWFEFAWETIGRLAGGVAGLTPSSAVWTWIERVLLPALPCWFGKQQQEEEEEAPRRWARALARMWAVEGDGGDEVVGRYLGVVVGRLTQLARAWREALGRTNFTPQLIKAGVAQRLSDVAGLTALMRAELGSLPLSKRASKVLDVLNALQQQQQQQQGGAALWQGQVLAALVGDGGGSVLQQVVRACERWVGASSSSGEMLDLVADVMLPAASTRELPLLLAVTDAVLRAHDQQQQQEEKIKLVRRVWGPAVQRHQLAGRAGVLTEWAPHVVQLGERLLLHKEDGSLLLLDEFAQHVARAYVWSGVSDEQEEKRTDDEDERLMVQCAAQEDARRCPLTEPLFALLAKGVEGGSGGDALLPLSAHAAVVMLVKQQQPPSSLSSSSARHFLARMQAWGFVNEPVFVRFHSAVQRAGRALGVDLPPGYA